MENLGEYVSQIREISNANNLWSAQQAQKQMDFQERMSSTAHQREIADLKAAGLNPVLSAGSNGAAAMTGASATAQGDVVSALGSIVQSLISSETSKSIAEQNNSAAMLRQQQSDSAAMERIIMQAQLKEARDSSSVGSSLGSVVQNNPNSSFSLKGLVDSLPEKGSTRVGKLTLPNNVIKYLYNTLGNKVEEFVNSHSYQEVLDFANKGKNSNNSAEKYYTEDAKALNPYGSMVSLETLKQGVNSAKFELKKAEGIIEIVKAAKKVNKLEKQYEEAKDDVAERKEFYSIPENEGKTYKNSSKVNNSKISAAKRIKLAK